MSKNKKIFIISIILGSLFSMVNINAMQNKIIEKPFTSKPEKPISTEQFENFDDVTIIDEDEIKNIEMKSESNNSEEKEEIENLLYSLTHIYNYNHKDNEKILTEIKTIIENDFIVLDDIEKNFKTSILNEIFNEIFIYENFLLEIKNHIEKFNQFANEHKNKKLINKISELNNKFKYIDFLVKNKKINEIYTITNKIHKNYELADLEQIKKYENLLELFEKHIGKLLSCENKNEKIEELHKKFLNLKSSLEYKKQELIINNNYLYKKITEGLSYYNKFLNNYDIPPMDMCENYLQHLQKITDRATKINTIKTFIEKTKKLANKLKTSKIVDNKKLLQRISERINQKCDNLYFEMEYQIGNLIKR